MQIKTKAGRTIHFPSPEEDAAITAAAVSDPDSQPLTDAEWAALRPRRGRPPAPTTKTRITIRIDSDIVAIYKAHAAKQGTSYQASMRCFVSMQRNSDKDFNHQGSRVKLEGASHGTGKSTGSIHIEQVKAGLSM